MVHTSYERLDDDDKVEIISEINESNDNNYNLVSCSKAMMKPKKTFLLNKSMMKLN